MKPILWVLMRVVFIALFGVECARMAVVVPSFPVDLRMSLFLLITYLFSLWRFSSVLRRRYEKKQLKDDWTASLWSSPILKNPESFFFIGGLAFVVGGLFGVTIVLPGFTRMGIQMFILVFGAGMLSGMVLFRFRMKALAPDRSSVSR